MSRTGRVVAVVVATLLGAGAPAVVAGRTTDPAPAARIPVSRSQGLLVTPAHSREPGQARDRRRAVDAPGSLRARPAALPPAGGVVAPRTLSIPGLGLRMPVAPYGVDRAGLMALPGTPYSLGWYRFGSGPWHARGATVLAGHVDTAEHGAGPLARLGELQPGAGILVSSGARHARYRVVAVRRVAKSVLDLPALFARSGRPRLHLVTCGGAYLPDRGGYQDNVVVLARRTASAGAVR